MNPDDVDSVSDTDAGSVAMTVEMRGHEFHIASDSYDPSAVQANGEVDVATTMHHGSQNDAGGNPNTESWFSDMSPEHVLINGYESDITDEYPAPGTRGNIDSVGSVGSSISPENTATYPSVWWTTTNHSSRKRKLTDRRTRATGLSDLGPENRLSDGLNT